MVLHRDKKKVCEKWNLLIIKPETSNEIFHLKTTTKRLYWTKQEFSSPPYERAKCYSAAQTQPRAAELLSGGCFGSRLWWLRRRLPSGCLEGRLPNLGPSRPSKFLLQCIFLPWNSVHTARARVLFSRFPLDCACAAPPKHVCFWPCLPSMDTALWHQQHGSLQSHRPSGATCKDLVPSVSERHQDTDSSLHMSGDTDLMRVL